MVSRAERTPLAEWWWTVDKLTLGALAALIMAGVVLSLAASPPVAARLGLDAFYFVNRHVMYLVPTVAVLLATSFLTPRQLRHVALVVFVSALLILTVELVAEAVQDHRINWREVVILVGFALSAWMILGWLRLKLPQRNK